MDLLINCDQCNGKGEGWVYESKTKEYKKCAYCNGKGKQVMGSEYLKYNIVYYNREIPYIWKIIKGELPIHWTQYAEDQPCYECDGEGGRWEKESDTKEVFKECVKCEGNRVFSESESSVKKRLFKQFLSAKEEKEKYVAMLESKMYLSEEYKEYKEKKPSPFMWVCLKCKNHRDGTDGDGGMDSCCGCCNENCGCTSGCYFDPINERAKEWYNNGGYKKNLGYDKNRNYNM